MTNTLIPGIYTSYELTGVRYASRASGTAGVIWCGSAAETAVSIFTSYNQIVSAYGVESSLSMLGALLFKNGASVIKAVQVKTDYAAGFALLMKENDVAVMLCDSENTAVHAAMLAAISAAGEDAKYRIGIVGASDTVDSLCTRAKNLNSERMVLLPSVSCAAAMAGLVLGSVDPSLPFNGAELSGAEEDYSYTDDEVNTLLYGGVTAVRTVGGVCEVVRAVTTKTETEGVYDSTWRDLNTILITDYVIPQIKSTLKAMFTRAKNTRQTREAVRTQVVIELERMLDMGIIDDYGSVTAGKSESDPAVCEVSFEFAVAGGMHQIIIAAGIIV